jgi:hypothetical protein
MPVPSGEHFAAVELFLHDLEQSGRVEEAGVVREGYACINGLTDGWALHLESLLRLESARPPRLTLAQRERLTTLCDAAYEAVYRRKRRRWGRLFGIGRR